MVLDYVLIESMDEMDFVGDDFELILKYGV